MKTYLRDNNTYQIFKVAPGQKMVHFLWGKFDFRIFFKKAEEAEAQERIKKDGRKDSQGTYYIVDRLEHLAHGQWHRFVKVVEHGFTFEEMEWNIGQSRYFAEFPRDLFLIAADVASEELELHRLNAEA